MTTLWDLLDRTPLGKVRRRPRRVLAAKARQNHRKPVVKPAPSRASPMQLRYESITRDMLATYGIRVHKWRSSMSGVAWEVHYKDGTISRLIESPKPKGPMSAAVFLHEVGHHHIGFGKYRPRCLEEYHAWRFSLGTMETLGLNVTPAVHKRMRDSLVYAVAKAQRRGLKRVPDELTAYLANSQPN